MRIAAKFAIIFVLLSIFSITVIGFYSYQIGRKTILDDKYGDLIATNDYLQALFERWVNESVRALEITAKTPFFRNNFNKLMASHDPGDAAHMIDHRTMVGERLSPIVEAGTFMELFIIRIEDGMIAFSTDKKQEEKRLGSQPFFVRGKNRSYVQNVYYSMSLQQAVMTVSTPIKNAEGGLVAVLAGHLNLAGLSAIMDKSRQINQTQDSYLVNKFNFFVTEPRFGKDYALKKSVHTQGVNDALSGNTGIGLYEDYRKIPVIGAYRWMPEWEICLISEIDQKEAFAPINALQKTVFRVCIILAICAAVAGWLTALTITRPLGKLIEDTQRLGKGDLDFSVRTTGKDEVGELARAFNQMTRELKETLVSRDALASEMALRKKVEAALQESEIKFRTIAETSPLGIFIVRQTDLKLDYVNPAVCRIFGYGENELIGKLGPMELTHPDDHLTTRQYLTRVLSGEHPEAFTFKGLPKSGASLICEVNVQAAEIDGLETFIGTLMDATERIRAKEQLQSEKNFSEALINSLPGVFYLFDEENLRFRRWNLNFENVTGYSSSEISVMSPLELFDEVEGARVAEQIGEAFKKGYSTVEAELLIKKGHRIPYFFTGQKLKIDQKTFLIGMGIDISERKNAEETLRESEDRFRRLAENAKDMIYRMSLPDGKYEYVSPAALEMFGYPPEVFYEEPILIKQAIHPDWMGYFSEQWEKLIIGDMPPKYEFQIIDSSGKTKWINQRNVLIRNSENRPIAIEGIATDVTDIKQVHQEQIRLEKFVVLGRIAAGMAHELNNPLMGILNYSQYCMEKTNKDEKVFSILKDIEHEAKRCINIVQTLLGASRLDESVFGKTTEIIMIDILDRVVRLMDYRISKENIKVSTEVDEGVPKIRMSSDAFQQLCLNLFTNAADAVATTEMKEINLKLQRNQHGIKLTVSDTGCGIPVNIEDKIFDPFFTTKDPGKGTGLGLATCWKIVHQQGGTIDLRSDADTGTTVIVTLPAQSGQPT